MARIRRLLCGSPGVQARNPEDGLAAEATKYNVPRIAFSSIRWTARVRISDKRHQRHADEAGREMRGPF